MSLDNTISTPLFQQLAETLRAAIDAGEYPPGSRLPTENELCERYSVSRVTVRKALDELSQGEFLVRKPGKGTFVTEKKIQRKLDGVLSYTNMCYMMGYQPGAKTIRITLEQPTEEERGQLGLKKDEQTLVVERLRLADGRPMMLETSKFPESFSTILFNCSGNVYSDAIDVLYICDLMGVPVSGDDVYLFSTRDEVMLDARYKQSGGRGNGYQPWNPICFTDADLCRRL